MTVCSTQYFQYECSCFKCIASDHNWWHKNSQNCIVQTLINVISTCRICKLFQSFLAWQVQGLLFTCIFWNMYRLKGMQAYNFKETSFTQDMPFLSFMIVPFMLVYALNDLLLNVIIMWFHEFLFHLLLIIFSQILTYMLQLYFVNKLEKVKIIDVY